MDQKEIKNKIESSTGVGIAEAATAEEAIADVVTVNEKMIKAIKNPGFIIRDQTGMIITYFIYFR